MENVFVMPAGKYYVGDLCYVTGREWWNEFCKTTIKGHICFDGKFTIMNNEICFFGTAHGDGYYNDNCGNGYGVDAGLIGIMKVEDITAIPKEKLLNEYVVVDFKEDFECYSESGVLTFGDISINTSYDEDEVENEVEVE